MRIVMMLMGAMALGFAAAAAALAPNGGMPDIAKTYYERQNCHEAYDAYLDASKNNGALSAADKAWAASYEAASGNDGKCPAPTPALAKAATNRVVSNGEALKLLVPYMNAGDPAAYFEAGQAIIADKVDLPKEQAGAMIRKASDLGYAPAQFMVGSLYIAGAVTGKADYAQGFPFIQQAAEGGHVDALFMLANMYKEGLGTKKDPGKAFLYYQRAAEMGHVYAAYLGAYMANDGDGVKADHALAYRLGRNLVDQGETVGAVISASALLQMKDAKDHEDEVLYWMDVAIRDGDEKIRQQVAAFRPRVVAAFKRANAPPEYQPRVWKACPMKTVCLVDRFSGVQQCTTNKDYWNDCDG